VTINHISLNGAANFSFPYLLVAIPSVKNCEDNEKDVLLCLEQLVVELQVSGGAFIY
jgi:hypothetical protein